MRLQWNYFQLDQFNYIYIYNYIYIFIPPHHAIFCSDADDAWNQRPVVVVCATHSKDMMDAVRSLQTDEPVEMQLFTRYRFLRFGAVAANTKTLKLSTQPRDLPCRTCIDHLCLQGLPPIGTRIEHVDRSKPGTWRCKGHSGFIWLQEASKRV